MNPQTFPCLAMAICLIVICAGWCFMGWQEDRAHRRFLAEQTKRIEDQNTARIIAEYEREMHS